MKEDWITDIGRIWPPWALRSKITMSNSSPTVFFKECSTEYQPEVALDKSVCGKYVWETSYMGLWKFIKSFSWHNKDSKKFCGEQNELYPLPCVQNLGIPDLFYNISSLTTYPHSMNMIFFTSYFIKCRGSLDRHTILSKKVSQSNIHFIILTINVHI